MIFKWKNETRSSDFLSIQYPCHLLFFYLFYMWTTQNMTRGSVKNLLNSECQSIITLWINTYISFFKISSLMTREINSHSIVHFFFSFNYYHPLKGFCSWCCYLYYFVLFTPSYLFSYRGPSFKYITFPLQSLHTSFIGIIQSFERNWRCEK